MQLEYNHSIMFELSSPLSLVWVYEFISRQKKLKAFETFSILLQQWARLTFLGYIPLFSLMCLMNIHIWPHFLRKCSCAKKSIEGWCDGAIMMVRWRYHRTIVIASSHDRHCTVVLLRHRPKFELLLQISLWI